MADDHMEDRLDSGDAAWCYLRLYFHPWLRKHDADYARRCITRQPPELRAQTDKLLHILQANQGVSRPADNDQDAASVSPEFNPECPVFQALLRCHKNWDRHRTIKSYLVNQADWLSGSTAHGKKAARRETGEQGFPKKLESPFNFFFDVAEDGVYLRASFSSIESLLALPKDKFGSPEEWLPYKGRGQVLDQVFDEMDDLTAVDDDDNEDAEVVVLEVGHLPSLREYQGFDVDRKPELLRQWITGLQDGNALGDGWFEVAVTNRPKYGIPGRLLPTSPASLAKITKEARAVSVQGRCKDLDFPASHLFSLASILESLHILHEFPMVQRFRTYCNEWRALWGKHALTMLMYGGVPDGDAWNPITWTLAYQIRAAGLKILACDQYVYLGAHFQDRQNPFYTRLYYALSAHEAHRLNLAHKDFEDQGCKVRALIYDGLLGEAPSEELLLKHGFVEKPMPYWKDNLFMVLRWRSEKTDALVEKIPDCRNACIFHSVLNVAGPKTKKALVPCPDGPHTYASVQRKLICAKTSEYLETATFTDLRMASPTDGFLLHWHGHCVGVQTCAGDKLIISDSNYPNRVKVSADMMQQLLETFDHPASTDGVCFFKLKKGAYNPAPFHSSLYLCAGGGGISVKGITVRGRKTKAVSKRPA